jgi:hypothetical protein
LQGGAHHGLDQGGRPANQEETYGQESKKGEKENKGQSKKVATGSGGHSARANFLAHL